MTMAYFWRCPRCSTLHTFGDDELPTCECQAEPLLGDPLKPLSWNALYHKHIAKVGA